MNGIDMKKDKASHSSHAPKKAERMADEIRGWIVSRHLVPGDRLPHEKELIETLGCGRGTIREALKILEAQGLLHLSRGAGGGPHVASISYESANDHLKSFFYFHKLSWSEVYEMRERVEPHTARLATPFLTDNDFTELAGTLTSGGCGCGTTANHDRRIKENRFHRIIADRCPNPLLRFSSLFILDMLADFVRYRNILDDEPRAFTNECAMAHQEIFECLRSGDAEQVAGLMQSHIAALKRLLTDREQLVEPHLLMARY